MANLVFRIQFPSEAGRSNTQRMDSQAAGMESQASPGNTLNTTISITRISTIPTTFVSTGDTHTTVRPEVEVTCENIIKVDNIEEVGRAVEKREERADSNILEVTELHQERGLR